MRPISHSGESAFFRLSNSLCTGGHRLDDPRKIPPREPGESKRQYAARLNAIGIPCCCGCGRAVIVTGPKCERPPRYTNRCSLRLVVRVQFHRRQQDPAFREALQARATARRWADPAQRQAQAAIAARSLNTPEAARRRALTVAAFFSDPANRRTRFKVTVSRELLARYPDHREWIEAHAAQLDADLAVYPEKYLDDERLRTLVEYREEPDVPDGDARPLLGAYGVAFCDLHGNRVETLAECR